MKINNYPTLKEIEEKGCFYSPCGLVPVGAKCEKCGGQLWRDNSTFVSTYPPTYFYYCSECGNNESSRLCLGIAQAVIPLEYSEIKQKGMKKEKEMSFEYPPEEMILKKAIETYGEEAQTLMFFEEVAELQKELCKNARGKKNTREIAEEIADVEIMLEQMKMIYHCRGAVLAWMPLPEPYKEVE